MEATCRRRGYGSAGIVLALLLALAPAVSWADLQRVTLGVGGMMCPI